MRRHDNEINHRGVFFSANVVYNCWRIYDRENKNEHQTIGLQGSRGTVNIDGMHVLEAFLQSIHVLEDPIANTTRNTIFQMDHKLLQFINRTVNIVCAFRVFALVNDDFFTDVFYYGFKLLLIIGGEVEAKLQVKVNGFESSSLLT